MKVTHFAAIIAVLCVGALALCQSPSRKASYIGTYHLVRIDAPSPDGKPINAQQPTGLLIYTRDGHGAVQLMYPQMTLSNEFVHDGYEATFGTIEVDEASHRILYHVQASATRDKLVGQTERLSYELPDPQHMIIRPTDPSQHWSVTWERYEAK